MKQFHIGIASRYLLGLRVNGDEKHSSPSPNGLNFAPKRPRPLTPRPPNVESSPRAVSHLANRFTLAARLMKLHARPDLAAPNLVQPLAIYGAGFKRRLASKPLPRDICVELGIRTPC